jgi:ubiquinol-cytochrome c reductase iron-sulfur subunit
MPALAHTTRAIARSWTAHQLPVAKAGCTALQTRNASASSFDSPFKGSKDSTKIPSFAAYRSKGGETGPKVFQYFMVGSMGALSALGAKATVQGMTTLHRHSLHTDCRAWDLEKTGSWNLWHSNWLFCG